MCVECTVCGLPFKKLDFPVTPQSSCDKAYANALFNIFTTNLSITGPATSFPLNLDSGL